jgi:NAD-dependent deacetylase
MKKIVVFTGAGISAESGVATFRDTDGLWYNYNVDEVATAYALKTNPDLVNEFHNTLRAKLKDYDPNEAHKALAKLEERFDVTVITQNIDNLHERAGSTNVLHLHGELYKSRSSRDMNKIYECLGDINPDDKAEDGSKLRPHTVLFDEFPYNVDESYKAIRKCDYLLIIGTSLKITYTLNMLTNVNENAKVIYIDPKPSDDLDYHLPVRYVKKKAVEGVIEVVNEILNNEEI